MRKGQFTALAFLAIIAVVVVAGVLLLKSSSERKEVVAEKEESGLVREFVNQCVLGVLKQGLVKAGEHGGYVDPSNPSLSRHVFVEVPGLPTRSEGFRVGGSFIPYWYFMQGDDSCTSGCAFSSLAPSVGEVEAQLEEYLEGMLPSCVSEFEEFMDASVKPLSDPSARVRIEDGKVLVRLRYELNISTPSSVKKVSVFEESLPVDFLNVYNTAKAVALQGEGVGKFLEKASLNVISIRSLGSDPEVPPPKGGSTIASKPLVFVVREVADVLKRDFQEFTSAARIAGSLNDLIPLTGNRLTDSFYATLRLFLFQDAFGINVSKLKVNFQYSDEWPLYLRINGVGYGVVSSEMSPLVPGGLIPLPYFLRVDDFSYDLSYPVLVEVTDPDAFNKEGFTLRFGLEVNLRNNDWNISSSEVVGQGGAQTLLCNPSSWNSGEVTVTARDDEGNPVSDAFLTFTCGSESCMVGFTDENGVFKSELPVCAGGSLTGEAEDLYGLPVPLATAPGRSESLTLQFLKPRTVNVTVKKYAWRKLSPALGDAWFLDPSQQELHPDEEALIMLEREDPPEFTAFAKFNGSSVEVDLIPGTYAVEGVLFRHFNKSKGYSLDEWVVPEEEVEGETVEETVFNDTIILGGVKGQELIATPAELAKGKLYVYVLGTVLEDVTTHQDIAETFKYDEETPGRDLFKPRFGG